MNANDYLSPEEIKVLTQKNDWKGWWMVLKIWGSIAAIFTLLALFPNVFTILLALVLLGGRQLACAILMHDMSHRAVFKSARLNAFVGNWLGGYPVINDCVRYRPYHIKHHVNVGTTKDPDLSLTYGYPTTVMSFLRKVARDLAGITGVKTQLGVALINFGYIEYTASRTVHKISQSNRSKWNVIKTGVNYYWQPLLANAMIWCVLWLCGAGWVFLVWVAALFTTFNFSLRVRSIAEHSMVPDLEDAHRNTRTTYANWWEKLLFAPNNVNYHAEHHLLMTVPPYNLPKMHQIIKARGFYEQGVLAQNYWQIIKMAVSKKA
ncbi:fatty acid desaturase family protein [uncultured Microscilla sp.]|uniref:fatty acid desaturase family protein n=1 Tax=uncultured Microscilla sp. TaxID=432653 RepID=UPI0026381245|nr:fatty acid desaturase family protein [uncultured Microscilla sp.]